MGKPPYRSAEGARNPIRAEGAATDSEYPHVLGPIVESVAGIDSRIIPKFSRAIKSAVIPSSEADASKAESAPSARAGEIAAWTSIKQRHLEGVEFGRLSIEERSQALAIVKQLDVIFSDFLDKTANHIVTVIARDHYRHRLDVHAVMEVCKSSAGSVSSYMNYINDGAINGPLRSVSRDLIAIILRYGSVLSDVYEEFIDSDHSQADTSGLSQQERLDLLIDFTLRHNGVGAHEFARALFPEREAAGVSESVSGVTIAPDNGALPDVAPAQWATDKQPGDTPPAFIQRHYEPWLGKGLARPDIKRLDTQLYVALANWLRNNDMPDDLDLPTLKEKNDRWVERIAAEGRGTIGTLTLNEAARIYGAIHRRKGQDR